MINPYDTYQQIHYPLGNALVPYGTPLHATELFLQLLKVTFSEMPDDYPFKYVESDYEKTGIAFDVTLNKESGVYGKRPLVVVSRGQQSTQPIDIGDFAAGNSRAVLKHGSNLVSSSVNISIISRSKAEVEIIGQTIFGILMMRRTHIPKALNIHMVDSISLSDVNKSEEDDTIFISQCVMSYTQQYVWSQYTDDPVLKAVQMSVSKMD